MNKLDKIALAAGIPQQHHHNIPGLLIVTGIGIGFALLLLVIA